MKSPIFLRVMPASEAALWLLGAMIPGALSGVIVAGGIVVRRLNGWDADVLPWWPPPHMPTVIFMGGYGLLLSATLAVGVAIIVVLRYRSRIDAWLPCVPAWMFKGGAIAIGLASLVSIKLSVGASQSVLLSNVCVGAVLVLRLALGPAGIRTGRAAWGAPALIVAASPLVFALGVTPFDVPNEFLTLPSKTILADGRVVDTINYLNAHQLESMYVADPRRPSPDADRTVLALRRATTFASDTIGAYAREHLARVWFDPLSDVVEIHGGVRIRDFLFFESLVRQADLPALRAGLLHYLSQATELNLRRFTSEERDFLTRNTLELERQLVLGRFYFHQAYVFGPALGQVLNHASGRFSQYGRGFTEALALVLSHVPERLRFNAYLAFVYASYALYAALVWLLTVQLGLTSGQRVFAFAVLLFTYLAPTISDTRLGVGLSPWRHPLDIVVLVLVWSFTARPNATVGGILAVAIGVATYWSRETGLFLGAAVIGCLAVHVILDWRSKAAMAWSISIIALALAVGWRFGNPNAQVRSLTMLVGVNTPDLASGLVPALTVVVLGLACGWWMLRPRQDAPPRQHGDWGLLGTALAYVAASAIYYLWYPSLNHIAILSGVLALGLPVGYRLFQHQYGRGAVMAPTVTIVALVVIVLMGARRWQELCGELRTFATHTTHEWIMPEGRITSTADPTLLTQTFDQIRRYDGAPSINILSPWEVLAPLAGKYEAGPFAVNYAALAYPSDVQTLINYLLTTANPVLFVDSGLARGEYQGIMRDRPSLPYLAGAERSRIGATVMLRRVFVALVPCYEKIDAGPLLDVYRRKSDAVAQGSSCKVSSQ